MNSVEKDCNWLDCDCDEDIIVNDCKEDVLFYLKTNCNFDDCEFFDDCCDECIKQSIYDENRAFIENLDPNDPADAWFFED